VDLRHGLLDQRVALAQALEQEELVAEQAPPDLEALEVAAGRQLLGLGVQQQRLVADVDEVAGQERHPPEDGGGAGHLDVGPHDQHLDHQDERDQRATEGELQRAAAPAQDPSRVHGAGAPPAEEGHLAS
jgi:hypothetical protein